MAEAIPTLQFEPSSEQRKRLMAFAEKHGLAFEEAVLLLASSALQMQELCERLGIVPPAA